MLALTQNDEALVAIAKKIIKDNFAKSRHHVACVLRCESKTFTALQLDIRGFDVCAEPIAISNALAENRKDFRVIVATGINADAEPEVINPCGNCRQMLLTYAPDIEIIVSSNGALMKATPAELLPLPY